MSGAVEVAAKHVLQSVVVNSVCGRAEHISSAGELKVGKMKGESEGESAFGGLELNTEANRTSLERETTRHRMASA